MNNVVDEVLAGSPKYTLTYNDNTTATGVSIDLETAVTTQGTPLNKALFDSIQSDLNTRLLIADKATIWDARNGTDDTKYMTPLKVKNQLQWLSYTGSGSNTSTTATTVKIYRSSENPEGIKRVVITGKIFNKSSGYMSYLNINGTAMNTDTVLNTTYPSTSTTGVAVRYGASRSTGSFKIDIDLSSKTYTLLCQFSPNVTGENVNQANSAFGCFDTLTDVTASLRGGGGTDDKSTVNYTVTYIY